ncbi:DUF3152 domain-containing protein [Streptomyces glaucus]|uniref:DUF3152 domain-containing protein n=1 Tax=Streptomyces glaucus TaxID=284029 RepID=A0ABP5WUE5_9ACTN
MGRHSRRGAAPKENAADTSTGRDGRPAPAPAGGRGWIPGTAVPGPGGGVPPLPDATPAYGVPQVFGDTPARGVPRPPDATPAHGAPGVRGGHPELREPGGGWGELGSRAGAGHGVPADPAAPGGPAGAGLPIPRQRWEGPRQEYLDAFDGDDGVLAPPAPHGPRTAGTPAAGGNTGPGTGRGPGGAPPAGAPVPGRGGRGRTFTGIAAAAVTTVLAVVVAGQVADERGDGDVRPQSATGRAHDARGSAAPADEWSAPSAASGTATPTYEQKMDTKYPLSATLKGSGKFDAVPGIAKAPGRGQKFTYRVDVEQGLGLDAELFAQAVQKTLNDDRSWAHDGARTFERIHSGRPDFVITLASPGTTALWCAKSGLDTTVDNVSCDSAATERVMINAYRWAQGSKTYGDEIHAYRQMLINHEVGHRLGHSHVTCDKDGDLAPVMQQQTKFLDHDGIHCRANPWPYPGS